MALGAALAQALAALAAPRHACKSFVVGARGCVKVDLLRYDSVKLWRRCCSYVHCARKKDASLAKFREQQFILLFFLTMFELSCCKFSSRAAGQLSRWSAHLANSSSLQSAVFHTRTVRNCSHGPH